MAGELNGMKVAVLATDGVEQVELDRPWQALEEAGAEPELVSLDAGTLTAYDHIDKAGTRTVDAVVSSADPDGYGRWCCPEASSTATSSAPTPTPWRSWRPSSTRASRWPRSATPRGCSSRPGSSGVGG